MKRDKYYEKYFHGLIKNFNTKLKILVNINIVFNNKAVCLVFRPLNAIDPIHNLEKTFLLLSYSHETWKRNKRKDISIENHIRISIKTVFLSSYKFKYIYIYFYNIQIYKLNIKDNDYDISNFKIYI